jgi:hypothetical protein
LYQNALFATVLVNNPVYAVNTHGVSATIIALKDHFPLIRLTLHGIEIYIQYILK